ncbi:hypothetical protein [Poritiphilus flavus]|uniref:Uncharacterized protein n=1 Tax=Poritiphilus flavus TaxID=2697053 RepID=A0A6L9E7W6_9FLAO|nr:hypothetical protein [Poritiphilus flavus]NAS10826.1 hypothetical protein [Poritiphilus flavus]
MSTALNRLLGPALLSIVSLIFVSYIPASSESGYIHVFPIEGSYELNTDGVYHLQLRGESYFEIGTEKTASGKPFKVIKLNLKSGEGHADHSLGFVISQKGENTISLPGTFQVNEKIDGFLDSFEGVFGFANIPDLGEQPFFAKRGKITISKTGLDKLGGRIDVRLVNPEGKQLIIKGNFTAIPRI